MTQLSTAPPCTPPTHLTKGARPVSPRPLAGASKHDKLFRRGGPASACPRSHCRGLVRTRVREGASSPWPSAQWKESSRPWRAGAGPLLYLKDSQVCFLGREPARSFHQGQALRTRAPKGTSRIRGTIAGFVVRQTLPRLDPPRRTSVATRPQRP